MPLKKIRNWDGSRTWEPREIHYPESAEEISGLIRRAAEDRKRVKALGSALSWSDITDSPDIAVQLRPDGQSA